MRSTKKATIVAAVGLVIASLARPGTAQPMTCPVVDISVEEVAEGVTLEWTSSFLCSDVPTDPSRSLSAFTGFGPPSGGLGGHSPA